MPPLMYQIAGGVVGDSISAGLDRSGEKTWPKMLRDDHHVAIVDLSRAGCTTSQAVRIVQQHSLGNGVVVIEIGGNDLIGKANPKQFGIDLDQLIRAVKGNNRAIVMFELPLFPFDNAYGLEQRQVADRYGIGLIPRRHLAAILASPGTTTDGIHFSNAGQRLLEELVWHVVGEAMNGPAG